MAVRKAPETSVSRKRVRFTVPPADTYSGSWGYGRDKEIQEHSESDGGNEEMQDEEDEQDQEEIQRDQEPSESDGDGESLDEEDELVEQERQTDQELSESGSDEESGQDEEGELVEQDEEDDQESQMDQESSESDGEDEEQDEEDDQVDQDWKVDQESSESDDEDAEQDEVDEQVEQERQIDQELSESDGEDDGQNIEEELAEGESQSIQAPVESAGSEEEGHEEEDEQVEQEMRIDQARSESDGEDEEWSAEELGEEESQNNPESADGDEERQEEEDEQVEDVSDGGHVQTSSSEPVLAPPPPSKRTTIANMTLDEDMLDCGVCCLPLKPPIFQCDVGHVVCSSCRNKLAAVGKCHVCRTSFTGGYRRCHALEQLVESIRGSCPNATYGCAARVPYYDLQTHLQACPHAPCHCPAEACGFVGSTTPLLQHFVSTHKWPCITGVQNREYRATDLHDGFNVVAVVHNAREYLFLLRVVRMPFGRAISSLCLHPQAAVDDSSQSPSNYLNCQLTLSYARDILKDFDLVYHHQVSSFRVACTDLSNGMPNPNDCFQFMVPNALQPETEATVSVKASFHIQ